MARITARCNRRRCQARRNLSKMPNQYARHPKCHVNGCDGLMYVDRYRLNKGARDKAPVCHDGCLFDWARDHDPRNAYALSGAPHRVSDKRCRHYEEWMIDRSVASSKHSPGFNRTDDPEAPF